MQDEIVGTAVSQIFLLILTGLAIHVAFLLINAAAAIIFGLSPQNFRAIVITGSQKNVSITLAVISFLPSKDFGSAGMLAIPSIISHLTQLFVDSYIAARMSAAEDRSKAETFPVDTKSSQKVCPSLPPSAVRLSKVSNLFAPSMLLC
jgi:solute carrier family 10 (sodium/bile acid cotransporter), member 7